MKVEIKFVLVKNAKDVAYLQVRIGGKVFSISAPISGIWYTVAGGK